MNPQRYMHTCARCAEDFRASRPDARFCSDSCRKRAHEAIRADCPGCGTPMTVGSRYPSHRPARCEACNNARRLALRIERAQQIAGWWNDEGLSMAAICARLGWSKGSLGSEMHWIREQGIELRPRRSDVGIPNPRRSHPRAVAA